MKKIILSAVAALLTAGAATAQIRFAPEVGLNLSSVTTKVSILGASESETSDIKVGGRIGVVAELGIASNIYFRPGVQFSMLGGKDEGGSIALNYIQVPLNVLYKFGEEGGGRFYVGLVPYLGLAVSAKEKEDSGDSEDWKIGTKEGEDQLKPLDLGIGIKAGYELPMGLYIDAAFLQGLSNNFPGGNSDFKMTNRNITIGVGFFLNGGGKKSGKM